jgi:MinD-like ATPase involved in chromosome partitioning or flagellar assembly
MAVIAMISAKGAPGATTTVAALARSWPTSVIVADCDPAGGDLVRGWLGQWLLTGRMRTCGVLSFVTATRHSTTATPTELTELCEHLQDVPLCPHIRLLAGLDSPVQAMSLGDEVWARLARVLRDQSLPDVLVDAGRYSNDTPWPLVESADLVLIAVRPQTRQVLATRTLLGLARFQKLRPRLGLALCATTSAASRDVTRALGVPSVIEIPADSRAAATLSDGTRFGSPPRGSALMRHAQREAQRLHAALASPTYRPPVPLSYPVNPSVSLAMQEGPR